MVWRILLWHASWYLQSVVYYKLSEREKTAALLGSYKFQWIDQQTPAVGIGKYEGRTGKTDQQTTNCS